MAGDKLAESFPHGKMRNSLFSIVLSLFFLLYVHGKTQENEDQLRRDLFESYNKDIRPPYNHSKPLDVFMDVEIRTILDVNVKESTYSFLIAISLIWQDYRLSWNPSNYSGIGWISLGDDKIWIPEIYLLYPAGDVSRLSMDNVFVWIFSNGTVLRSLLSNVKATFQSNMTYFPTDVQICKMQFMADGFLSNEVNLKTNKTNIGLSFFIESKEWGILDTVARLTSMFGSRDEGVVEFKLTLRRKNKYFVVNMISPIVILALVNPLVFLLPPENGERVVFSVSMMLSYGIFMKEIRDRVPEVSDPMSYLVYYMMTALILSAVITVVTIINTRLYSQPSTKPIPKWLTRLVCVLSFRFVVCICVCWRRKTKVQSLMEEEKSSEGSTCTGKTWETMARSLDLISFWYCIIALSVIYIHAYFMLPGIA